MAYIDAEKFLKDEIKRCGCVPLVGSCTADNESLAYQLAKTPTADVVEVKHGEWKKSQFSGRSGFYSLKDVICSECGIYSTFPQDNIEHPMFYCPNCGAKMDKERSDT